MSHRRRSQRAAVRRRPITVPALDPALDTGAVAAALAAAIEDHRAGRLTAAAASYRSILEAEPDHFDALNHLGVVMNQTGNNTLTFADIGDHVRLAGFNNATDGWEWREIANDGVALTTV